MTLNSTVDSAPGVVLVSTTRAHSLNTFYKHFALVHPYVAFCLCIFGLLANSCLIAVLSRPRMRSTVNRLLISIASIDTALMLSYSIYLAHFKIADRHACPVHLFTYEWTIFQMLHANFSVYARACTLWLSATVAGYSKYVVTLSTPIVQYENCRIGSRLTLGVMSAVLAATAPIFLQNFSIKQGPPAPPNDTTCPRNHSPYYVLRPIEFASASTYAATVLSKITFMINGIVLKFLPCLLLAYFLAFLLYSLYSHRKWRTGKFVAKTPRQSISNNNQQQTNVNTSPRSSLLTPQNSMPTTFILTTILLTTLICELPNAFLSLITSLSNLDFVKAVYVNLGDVLDLLSLFTCTSTSILYCFMSQLFRETFRQLFFDRRRSSSSAAAAAADGGSQTRNANANRNIADYSATTGNTMPRSRSGSPSFLTPLNQQRKQTLEDERRSGLNMDNLQPLLNPSVQ